MALLVGWTGSCTPGHYSKFADRETKGILRFKSSKVPNSGRGIDDITPPSELTLDHLRRSQKGAAFLGDRAHIEKNAKIITLADALQFAVERNRPYRDQKESLYLLALDLTLARHQFAPIFVGAGTATTDRTQVEVGVNDFITHSTQTVAGSVGFSMLTKAGTRIAADLSTDFFRFLTGQLREVSDSELAVTITQPLLRGAGYLAVTEPLTQAERDTLYAIRDFTQFRKTFAVNITSQYYRTLQARDTAKNAHLAYTAFKGIVEREKGMAEANRRSLLSLGLIQQAEITYQRRWLAAIKLYEDQLDSLKIELGLPVSTPLILDEKELEKLKLLDPPGTLDEAMRTAITTRLDLWNARDRLQDANRKIKVAKQDLLPSLASVVKYDVKGDPGADGLVLDGSRRKVSVGLELDFHLDKKAERNVLRASEVFDQKTKRDLDLAEEGVRQQIRADWRDLGLARQQYELAQRGMELSARQLQMAEEMLQVDRSTARDLIDAQQDLIEAQDLLTATLVNHTIARMTLWKDMGILFIKKDGSWVDVLKRE
jgi:outer membrane protein TolC